MQKNKTIQKDYSNSCKVYQLDFPVETGILIPEDDSVRLLSQIMEELDYTKL
ncbi:MAG: IS5/IS1182 family transposase, partial [Clostridiaceae bacterium]|nr:IS5/IS1182 family transposase [Clostridiaceae bacterium]